MNVRSSLKRKPLWVLLVAIALALVLARSPGLGDLVPFLGSDREQPAASQGASGWRMVTHVIDGDTLKLDGEETVRLIGVDAPERSHSPRAQRPGRDDPYAVEATRFLRELAEGQSVRLDYEGRLQDRYGRTLAYVYLTDGTFVNEELIRTGYARTYRNYSFPFREQFLQLEREARAAHRGLWTVDNSNSME